MKIAVLSDIHANRWALEAVVENIKPRNVDYIFNLGDSFYGPLDPAGTADILLNMKVISVCGNQDRIIYEPDAETTETLLFVRSCLREQHINWLKDLKNTFLVMDKFLLFHGMPSRDDQYLLWKVMQNSRTSRQEDEILQILKSCNQKFLFCGHDHIPQKRILQNDTVILNPGSVGLQAYTDNLPYEHFMETYSPHARYMLLNYTDDDDWSCEIIKLDYNWKKASQTARKNNRPDWEKWLMTGKASE